MSSNACCTAPLIATPFLVRNSKVQFVTFNFDRLIERHISEIIGSSSMAGDLGAAKNSLSVYHVHGTLPPLPNCPFKYDSRFYHNEEWSAWLNAAAEAIHDVSGLYCRLVGQVPLGIIFDDSYDLTFGAYNTARGGKNRKTDKH